MSLIRVPGFHSVIEKDEVCIECEDPGLVSDGYHTFDEFYEHQCLLFCAFLVRHGGWKSRLHDDGSSLEGWFIAGTEILGEMITYHLPDRMWELCYAQIYERSPKWDGHSSQDVVARLKGYLSSPPIC